MKDYSLFGIIGNVLIATGFFLLLYIYLPYIILYLPIPNKNQHQITSKTISIEIPKINATAPIIENVDPWKKEDYTEKLIQGVAQAKGFATIGEKGTIFLFAHSSLPPWEMTRANTSFLRLNELTIGDNIYLSKYGKKFSYKVIRKTEVWPNEVTVVQNDKIDQLILQTCIPLGTDLKRLLIFAEPVKDE